MQLITLHFDSSTQKCFNLRQITLKLNAIETLPNKFSCIQFWITNLLSQTQQIRVEKQVKLNELSCFANILREIFAKLFHKLHNFSLLCCCFVAVVESNSAETISLKWYYFQLEGKLIFFELRSFDFFFSFLVFLESQETRNSLQLNFLAWELRREIFSMRKFCLS